jgi:putative hydrolase of the HAD superfamily
VKVVFDVAGVLLRWRPVDMLRSVLPQHAVDDRSGTHWAQQIFQGFGGEWGEFDRGAIDADALVRRIAARTGLRESEVREVVRAVPEELQPIDGTVDLLQRLHAAHVPLYYLSNMPGPYADQIERRHAFFDLFADGVFSARIGLAKPQAEIFAVAAQRFGADPGELVFLDDHLPNVTAAQAAGWRALHFLDAAQCEAALRARGWWPRLS